MSYGFFRAGQPTEIHHSRFWISWAAKNTTFWTQTALKMAIWEVEKVETMCRHKSVRESRDLRDCASVWLGSEWRVMMNNREITKMSRLLRGWRNLFEFSFKIETNMFGHSQTFRYHVLNNIPLFKIENTCVEIFRTRNSRIPHSRQISNYFSYLENDHLFRWDPDIWSHNMKKTSSCF